MIKKILVYVFALHLLGIVGLCIDHVFHKESPKKKIIVRTFKKELPPPPPKVVAKAPLPKKQVPVKQKPKPKKAPAPVPIVKKLEKPQVVPKEQAPKEQAEKVLDEYGEALIVFFQNSLDLPEYGEVKLSIEIDAAGHITLVDVLEGKSKENEEFLKKQLPELVCPCFNGDQTSRNTFAFTIVFKNR